MSDTQLSLEEWFRAHDHDNVATALADLRAQLAEAQAHDAVHYREAAELAAQVVDLRAQLAEAEALEGRLRGLLAKLETEWAAALAKERVASRQAEWERDLVQANADDFLKHWNIEAKKLELRVERAEELLTAEHQARQQAEERGREKDALISRLSSALEQAERQREAALRETEGHDV